MPRKRSSVLLTGGVCAAHASALTVTGATPFAATSGGPAQAHGGGGIEVGRHYYRFGEGRVAGAASGTVDGYHGHHRDHNHHGDHETAQPAASRGFIGKQPM